jgi:hypothetical protein
VRASSLSSRLEDDSSLARARHPGVRGLQLGLTEGAIGWNRTQFLLRGTDLRRGAVGAFVLGARSCLDVVEARRVEKSQYFAVPGPPRRTVCSSRVEQARSQVETQGSGGV